MGTYELQAPPCFITGPLLLDTVQRSGSVIQLSRF